MTPKAITNNTLFYSDNLSILREHIADDVDGMIAFFDYNTSKPKRTLVLVKSGHVKSGDIRDLRGTVEREGAATGIFITLEDPTRDMVTEAAASGLYHSPAWGRDYPKIQILTVEELLHGGEVKMPPTQATFKQAPRVAPDNGVVQPTLGME